jgi:Fe-S cluster biogenesis protein NfuA/nitrite reductase/ring-hydroxylating ferredoxin subunit
MPEDKKFPQRIQQIEELINKFENHADPEIRASARELVQLLMEAHGAGLERIMETLWRSENGEALTDKLANDDLVGPLLLLYGMHPVDLKTRVLNALDKVRPYLRSHGGNVDLIDVSESGDVRLRLQGSCNGCPSSAMTLKLAIEETIDEYAPDVNSLQVEGVVETKLSSGFVPIQKLKESQLQNGWKEVNGLDEISQGAVKTLEVSGQAVLFCRVAESYYAYSTTCPHCASTLQGAILAEPSALTCPACGQKYDVLRAGRGLDQPALHLQPFPLLMEHGRTKIALPAM